MAQVLVPFTSSHRESNQCAGSSCVVDRYEDNAEEKIGPHAGRDWNEQSIAKHHHRKALRLHCEKENEWSFEFGSVWEYFTNSAEKMGF